MVEWMLPDPPQKVKESMRPCMHTCMHACTHACMNACMHPCMLKQTIKQMCVVPGFSCGLFLFDRFYFWVTYQGKPRVYLRKGRQGAVERGYA